MTAPEPSEATTTAAAPPVRVACAAVAAVVLPAVALSAVAASEGAGASTPVAAPPAIGAVASGPLHAQEADAVAPGDRRDGAPDSVPARGGASFSPLDSVAGPGPGGEELDALTAKVSSRLRCPVCRSQSVLESSATLAQQMQREIRRRLAQGQTPEEVEDYFVSRYGEWILLKPEPRGINLLVYLLPAAALLAGAFLVWGRLREWTAPAGAADGTGTAGTGRTGADDGASGGGGEEGLSPEEEARIDALVREREGGPTLGGAGDGA